MDTVTKPKHPGRVAQGHRLVALNRGGKKSLKVEQPAKQPAEQHAEHSSHTTFYGGEAVVILVGVGFALYLYHKKSQFPPRTR